MPHSKTHKSTKTPPKKNSPAKPTTDDLPDDLASVLAGAFASIGQGDKKYRDKASAYLKKYTGSQFRPDMLQYGITPGAAQQMGRGKIDELQVKLIRAGLLDPKDVTHSGAPSLSMIKALIDLEEIADAYGFADEDKALAMLADGFTGWEGTRRQGKVFVENFFDPTSRADVESDLKDELQDETGRARPDALARGANTWMSRERERFEANESLRRQQYEAQIRAEETGEDITIAAPRLPAEPTAASVAETVIDPNERQVYQVARFGLALQQMFGGG